MKTDEPAVLNMTKNV